jgi:hypothetical protein
MRKQLIRTKYEDVYNNIDDATTWLSDHGLEITRTRIGEYKRAFKCLIKKYNSGTFTLDEQKSFFVTYVNLVFEVQELVYIYQGLSKIPNNQLAGRLKRFIKGPSAVTDENPSKSTNAARNIAFELLIASQLSSSGIEIDFGTDADMSFTFEDNKFFIECKRPQYTHQINSNIKGANKQLLKRYRTCKEQKKAFGIVALSVSKILNPKFYILISQNTNSMHSHIENLLNKFHTEHKAKYLNPSDPKTIGMMVQFSTPVSLEDEKIIAHSHLLDLTNCCDPRSKKIEYITRLSELTISR